MKVRFLPRPFCIKNLASIEQVWTACFTLCFTSCFTSKKLNCACLLHLRLRLLHKCEPGLTLKQNMLQSYYFIFHECSYPVFKNIWNLSQKYGLNYNWWIRSTENDEKVQIKKQIRKSVKLINFTCIKTP